MLFKMCVIIPLFIYFCIILYCVSYNRTQQFNRRCLSFLCCLIRVKCSQPYRTVVTPITVFNLNSISFWFILIARRIFIFRHVYWNLSTFIIYMSLYIYAWYSLFTDVIFVYFLTVFYKAFNAERLIKTSRSEPFKN
jgi:hypothetical protein